MFVIELTYKAQLAEIDAQMGAHVRFLKKYYASGNFLVSGRISDDASIRTSTLPGRGSGMGSSFKLRSPPSRSNRHAASIRCRIHKRRNLRNNSTGGPSV
jgi:hypothetical protein